MTEFYTMRRVNGEPKPVKVKGYKFIECLNGYKFAIYKDDLNYWQTIDFLSGYSFIEPQKTKKAALEKAENFINNRDKLAAMLYLQSKFKIINK